MMCVCVYKEKRESGRKNVIVVHTLRREGKKKEITSIVVVLADIWWVLWIKIIEANRFEFFIWLRIFLQDAANSGKLTRSSSSLFFFSLSLQSSSCQLYCQVVRSQEIPPHISVSWERVLYCIVLIDFSCSTRTFLSMTPWENKRKEKLEITRTVFFRSFAV